MKAERFPNNPIIHPGLDESIGTNINGPSLIRVPDWLENPLGKYYLYFGHHQGKYIRLAYADALEGPWKIYRPGVLDVTDSFCTGHIASPDVIVDDASRVIRLYYHGPIVPEERSLGGVTPELDRILAGQRTKLALSKDGLHFEARPEVLGAPYFRVFQWKDAWYALGMPGLLYRSDDGLTGFAQGPQIFDNNMRHSALLIRNDTLHVFYSNAGDTPERILCADVDLNADWKSWKASEAVTVLAPELAYEGADMPLETSRRGWARDRVHQLRDPGIYEEGGAVYLLYSVAGEQGIAIARLQFE